MLSIISFILYFQSVQTENLVFPFKKLTIEYLNKTKTISDFINYNIYTNISIGTPKKSVAHFITSNSQPFSYDIMHLHYRGGKVNNNMQKEIENSLDIFYIPQNSSTIEKIDINNSLYSDIYYFNDINHDEIIKKINFNIIPTELNQKLCGIIDLYYQDESNPRNKKRNFIQELKDNNIINNGYLTFIYGEYDIKDDLKFFNDDYNNILGNLIIGESPHVLAPDKYKEEDEIKINGIFALNINEIKSKSNISNYIEKNVRLNLKYNSEFILGSNIYRDEIDNIFFNDLLSKKLCRKDFINENIYISQALIYSCENNDIVLEKMKSFPTLYFEIKDYDLKFRFNYKELFKLHNNRLYFLIMFKTNSHNWESGDLFFRKYITSINYYSKTISFYKTQVEEINRKTDIFSDIIIIDKDSNKTKNDKTSNNNYIMKIIILILFGIIIIAAILVLILLVIKLNKTRKKRADELNDDYEYIPQGRIN